MKNNTIVAKEVAISSARESFSNQTDEDKVQKHVKHASLYGVQKNIPSPSSPLLLPGKHPGNKACRSLLL